MKQVFNHGDTAKIIKKRLVLFFVVPPWLTAFPA